MSYKGVYVELKIEDESKFIEELPIELRKEFDGVLYYDEQGYGNNNRGLSFKRFEKPMIDAYFEYELSEENKKFLKEEAFPEDEDMKGFLVEMLEDSKFIILNRMINEKCKVIYNNKEFIAKIINVRRSCS